MSASESRPTPRARRAKASTAACPTWAPSHVAAAVVVASVVFVGGIRKSVPDSPSHIHTHEATNPPPTALARLSCRREIGATFRGGPEDATTMGI